MTYSIALSGEAKTNIKEALDYYAAISTSLSSRFESELDHSMDGLMKNPLSHQVRYRNIRIAFTDVFPFGIHYIIKDENIFVLKILHTKRFFK